MRAGKKLAIVIALPLLAGATGGVVFALGSAKDVPNHRTAGGPTPAPTAGTWSSTVRTATSTDTSQGGVTYKTSLATPEFSGAGDARAIRAVNMLFHDRARKEIDDLATTADQSSSSNLPTKVPFSLTESAEVHRIGRIAAVEFSGEEYVGGSAHGFLLHEWVLIRTDTWTQITKDQLLLPAARTAEGATRLAGVLAPSVTGGDPSCHTDAATLLAGGRSPDNSATPAGFEDVMTVGLSPDSVEFGFRPYYLFAFGCGWGTAKVPFSALDGLVNPDIVRLATTERQ